MPVKAHQITKLDLPDVKVSVGDALNAALFWRKERLAIDDQMFAKWVAGEVDYPTLAAYFENRLKIAVGQEALDVEATKLKATEKKQNVDDQFKWNQYLAGHIDFNNLTSYMQGRLKEEKENTPGYQSLQEFMFSALEKERVGEETQWRQSFDLGKVSYDQYKEFLDQRISAYPANSERRVGLEGVKLTIEPQYQINELQRLYASGFWGNPKGDGTFDFLQNEIGFQVAIGNITSKYAEGSPQRFEFEQAKATSDARVRQFRFDQDKASASLNRNSRYREFVEAQQDLENIRLNFESGRAGQETMGLAQTRFDTAQANYNLAEDYLQKLQASPQNVTSTIPSAVPFTPATPGSSIAPAATVPVTTPSASQNQPPAGQPLPARPSTKPAEIPKPVKQMTNPDEFALFVQRKDDPTVFGVGMGGEFLAFRNMNDLNSVLKGRQVQVRDTLDIPTNAGIFGSPTELFKPPEIK